MYVKTERGVTSDRTSEIKDDVRHVCCRTFNHTQFGEVIYFGNGGFFV